MKFKININNQTDTIQLAQNIEALKFENMVICLDGELGAGKTLFSKAFAKAMGIEEEITSPTFSIIKEYNGELPLFHMDVYRLENGHEGVDIETYFTAKGVCLIEWSQMIEDILPIERLDIEIKIVNENERVIYLKPYGEKYIKVVEGVI